MTDIKVSARCCHLFKKAGETSEGGKDMTATAPEDRTMPFKDLIKESISQSYNEMQIQHQILQ